MAASDVYLALEHAERAAQRDADRLAHRTDPYAKARIQVTLEALGHAREAKQRLTTGDLGLDEAARIASDLQDVLTPTP